MASRWFSYFTWDFSYLGVAVPYFAAAFSMPIDADIASYAIGKFGKRKVRFIGVGTIGTAAIWTLLILMKSLLQGMAQSFPNLERSILS